MLNSLLCAKHFGNFIEHWRRNQPTATATYKFIYKYIYNVNISKYKSYIPKKVCNLNLKFSKWVIKAKVDAIMNTKYSNATVVFNLYASVAKQSAFSHSPTKNMRK